MSNIDVQITELEQELNQLESTLHSIKCLLTTCTTQERNSLTNRKVEQERKIQQLTQRLNLLQKMKVVRQSNNF